MPLNTIENASTSTSKLYIEIDGNLPVCKAVMRSLAVLVLLKRLPKRPWGRHWGAPSPADHVIKKTQMNIERVSTAFII